LNKRSNKVASPTLGGCVVASFGRSFMVELADGSLITCTTRGKRTDIACGDRVQIAMTAPEQGVIEVIEPRASLMPETLITISAARASLGGPTNNATAIRENRERLRESMDHLVA
jgi:translation initiation factor IF-1